MARELLGGRVVLTRRMATMAVVDALAISLFVGLGELRHAGTIAAGIETYLQFLLGWIIAAVVFRAYTPRAVSTPGRAALLGAQAWFVAALLGQGIRLLVNPLARFAPSFVLVSILAGGVLVAAGRGLVSIR